MNSDSHKSIVLAGALLLAAAIGMGFFGVKWPAGYMRQNIPPMLALELPHDVEEFQAITDAARVRVRRAQYADFGFIAVYVFFFVVFAIGIDDDRTLTSMCLATLVTALADVGEDIFILHAVHDAAPTPGELRGILIFGCVKWLGFFAIVLAAAVAMQSGGALSRIAALVFRLSALVGIYAAIASFASAAARPLVALASRGAGLTFLAILIAYTVSLLRPRSPEPAPA